MTNDDNLWTTGAGLPLMDNLLDILEVTPIGGNDASDATVPPPPPVDGASNESSGMASQQMKPFADVIAESFIQANQNLATN